MSPPRRLTSELAATFLVLAVAAALWLAMRAAAATIGNTPTTTPSVGPSLISADTAVAQAVAAAQAGGPYTRLDVAPTEVRAQLDRSGQPRWIVVLRGRVIETVPASAGGDVPERELVLHQLRIVVDAQTAEAIEIQAFPADHEMDASALPLRALPIGPVATPPQGPPPMTEAPLPTLAAAPNFAFRFEYGACFTDVLDAFENTYSQDRGTSERSITIPITLTAVQLQTIHAKLVAIDFFSYPEQFVIQPPDGVRTIMMPANRYALTVRDDQRSHTVAWLDEIVQPTTPAADRLRELFQLIVSVIQAQPEIQQLPPRPFGCL